MIVLFGNFLCDVGENRRGWVRLQYKKYVVLKNERIVHSIFFLPLDLLCMYITWSSQKTENPKYTCWYKAIPNQFWWLNWWLSRGWVWNRTWRHPWHLEIWAALSVLDSGALADKYYYYDWLSWGASVKCASHLSGLKLKRDGGYSLSGFPQVNMHAYIHKYIAPFETRKVQMQPRWCLMHGPLQMWRRMC